MYKILTYNFCLTSFHINGYENSSIIKITRYSLIAHSSVYNLFAKPFLSERQKADACTNFIGIRPVFFYRNE